MDLPITVQPRDDDFNGNRRPIPVSTIEWQSTITNHFAPSNGLDFLINVNQLIIQQTVELNELMSTLDSENRYIVKIPRGETIFYATESSKSCERTCCGSNRSFSMRLYDPTRQEVIQYNRRLACGIGCSLFCYLQEMEVWIPPGEPLGIIKQNFNIKRPSFTIINSNNEYIYTIEGPDSILGCYTNNKQTFQIFNIDNTTQVGCIIYQWDPIQVDYNLYIQMPMNDQNTRNKALLLGGAFLLEYMYFINLNRKMCRCL